MTGPATTITRRKGAPEFEILRKDMLDNVQNLSAHKWTDYNLHDPGVTILEQLCYALTDINFRSNYDVKTLLANTDGIIDLHQHGLYTQQEALPCRPVSTVDIQKYLLDRMPNISYVDIEPYSILSNLWRVRVKPYNIDECKTQITKAVTRHFNAIRNLNENICDVNFIADESCTLSCSLFIEPHVNPEDTLSQLYVIAESFLLGDVERSDFEAQKNNDDPLSSFMDGPLLTQHYISDDAIITAHRSRPISELISLLVAVPGIQSVGSLRVQPLATQAGEVDKKEVKRQEVEAEKPSTPPAYTHSLPAINVCSLRLVTPTASNNNKIQIFQNGQQVDINFDDFLHAYQTHKNHAEHIKSDQSTAASIAKIEHKVVDIKAYSSVQSQFPSNYGINAFGVPSHSDKKRKGQANQLKGYLLLFDQVMKDHLMIADNIKLVYSTKTDDLTSYPSQKIDASEVSDLDLLYVAEKEQGAIEVGPDYDHKNDRKSRVLDYLLAINGRDKQLLGFEYKNPYFSLVDQQTNIIGTKKSALQQVHELAENRGSSFDYSKISWGTNNISTLEKRILLTLGLDTKRRSLVLPLVAAGASSQAASNDRNKEADDTKFHFFRSSDKVLNYLANRYYRSLEGSQPIEDNPSLEDKPPLDDKQPPSVSNNIFSVSKLFAGGNKKFLKRLKKQILSHGCNYANYRLVPLKKSGNIGVALNIEGTGSNLALLAVFKSSAQAQSAIDQLYRSIQSLNVSMEGMHLVEHVLLLPINKAGQVIVDGIESESFYNHQVSIVLPSWTARFCNLDFRQYVEDCIRQECPAHIFANVYWLDFAAMEQFEILFKAWCEQKQCDRSHKASNEISKRLTTLLKGFYAAHYRSAVPVSERISRLKKRKPNEHA